MGLVSWFHCAALIASCTIAVYHFRETQAEGGVTSATLAESWSVALLEIQVFPA